MAQNIKINGVTYNFVSSLSIPLDAGGDNAVFPDTSDATATAGDIADGKTAYVDGSKVTGTGTAAGLNLSFKAYATEAAMSVDTPAEYTIGIVTTTAIGTVYIDNATPTGITYANGDVLILTGSQGDSSFNAVSDDSYYVGINPRKAMQYISGVWTTVTAQIYLSGAWVDWITYLYNEGNEFTARTGGWDLLRIITPVVTKTTFSDHINITTTQSGANAPWFVFGCNNDIDVTDFNTLTVTTSGTMSGLNIGLINNARSGAYPSFLAFTALGNATSPTAFTVDISSITGTHSVGISSTGNVSARNFDMWSCRLD